MRLIALTQCGAGHYDAAVQAPPPSDSHEELDDNENEENEAVGDGTVLPAEGRRVHKARHVPQQIMGMQQGAHVIGLTAMHT